MPRSIRFFGSARVLAMLANGLFVAFAVEGPVTAAPGTSTSLQAGVGVVDVTPDLKNGPPVFMAGQESNRRAEGVHDALNARALVLDDGQQKIALVAVDSIGVQHPLVQEVRKLLPQFAYVLVASTHTHEGPDVIGIWGPSPTESGVDPKYLEQLRDGIVEAVKKADQAKVAVHAEYGSASDETLLKDFRLPEVLDPTLRAIRFLRDDNNQTAALLVQWNTHPVEPDGNKLLTRDLIGMAVDRLEAQYKAPVVYFSGAVGGLMGTPEKRFLDANGKHIAKDVYDFMRLCGEAVAELVGQALANPHSVKLTPIAVAAQPTMLPLANKGYRQARAVGVLTRPAFAPGANAVDGPTAEHGDVIPPAQLEGDQLVESEVGYLRLGDVHVATIPGELYPELVYGRFQEPADRGADFATAPLERHLMDILPSDKVLILGLANDAVGYIIPKRQWDVEAPYAYGRKSAQYGERNSLGPDTARYVTEALSQRVAETKK